MHSERATQNVFDKSMATCREDTVRSPSKKENHHYHLHHQYENASSGLLILKAEIMPHSGNSDQLEKWFWLKKK